MTEVGADLTVHRVEGNVVWASRGYRLLCSKDAGENWQDEGSVVPGGWRAYSASSPFLRRMTRSGIWSLVLGRDGKRLCLGPKGIFRAEGESTVYRKVLRISSGSRPLNLCLTPDGEIYWGEYFLNLRRARSVRIFRSRDDGRSWEIAHVFPAGSICHVHRVVYDPYDASILVCTGDRDREVGIWKGPNGLTRLNLWLGGSQRYRTTCPIPRDSCILYGTDCPSGENFIMALDRNSLKVEQLQPVPGPVLYGCEVGDKVVFSTMVERQHHEATLWLGDESGFRLLAQFDTRKWHRLWRELVGYPTVILPEGKGGWPLLFATPIGTRSHAGCLLRMDLSRNPNAPTDGEPER